MLKACCYLSSAFCPTSVPGIIMLFWVNMSKSLWSEQCTWFSHGNCPHTRIHNVRMCLNAHACELHYVFLLPITCLSAGLTGGECQCLSQGRCHSWTWTPPPPSSITHNHMKENEVRHLYKHSFTHKVNLFLLYSFLISHSLYFSHTQIHT